jgi:hypothetical protein
LARLLDFLAENEKTHDSDDDEGDARPDTLVYLRLHDLDAVAAEFGLTPQDAPWGRELHLTDPDGNRLRIGPPAEQ